MCVYVCACVSPVQLVLSALSPFFWSESDTALNCPNPSLPYPPSLLQGSCTPLMVATLHPPSAGIAPQYSLPLGLGAGVGRPTLLEHTATVLVKQWWHPRRQTCTCTLPLPLTVPSLSCPFLYLSFVCNSPSPSVPHIVWGWCLFYASPALCLFTSGVVMVVRIMVGGHLFFGLGSSILVFFFFPWIPFKPNWQNLQSVSKGRPLPTAFTHSHSLPAQSLPIGVLKAWSACVAALVCALLEASLVLSFLGYSRGDCSYKAH